MLVCIRRIGYIILITLLTGCYGKEIEPFNEEQFIKSISSDNFSQMVSEQPGAVLVFFYRENSGDTDSMSRHFERLYRDYKGYVKFRKFDWNQGRRLDSYSVKTLPTINFYFDGRLKDQIGGIPRELKEFTYWGRDIELWMRETVLQSYFRTRKDIVYHFKNTPVLKFSSY